MGAGIKKNILKSLNFSEVLLFILIAVLIGMYIVIGRKETIHNYRQFYNTDLYGGITSMHPVHGTVKLIINTRDDEYVFSGAKLLYAIGRDAKLIKGQPAFRSFEDLARVGDSIEKKAYADTITLIKEGRKFYFDFDKIDTLENL